MTDKKRGIVDPWRRVDPFVPSRAPAPQEGKRDLDDSEWRDEDLAIPGKYIIRSKHISFDVTSTRIQVPRDALEVLADCVVELGKNKHVGIALINAAIGARSRMGTFNVPAPSVAASRLENGLIAIWFVAEPLDRGMAKLGRILRSSPALPTCRKHGIVTMLKT